MSDLRIGPYRLLRLLMTGQNSQVWEAMHDARQQRYAVKSLLPEHADDREQLGYLKNEFTVGSTLDHPRVIRAIEVGKHQKVPYLVMEFFPHPNLKFYIQQALEQIGPVIPKVIEQAAEGLAYFHSKDWVHRDVKPENFLVTEEGETKLIDFALAQRPKGALARLLSPKSKIQGTRSYMSPEQIRGQPLDARSDIYSFGCMLHELLCGKTPFTGADTNELLTKHLRSAPPSLTVANRNVTPEMANLVQRMLSKKPDGRPPSMEAVLREYRSLRVFKQAPQQQAEEDGED